MWGLNWLAQKILSFPKRLFRGFGWLHIPAALPGDTFLYSKFVTLWSCRLLWSYDSGRPTVHTTFLFRNSGRIWGFVSRVVTRNLRWVRRPIQNMCGGIWQECVQQAEQVCEVWGFNSSAAHDSGLLGSDAVSLGERFLTFDSWQWRHHGPSNFWETLSRWWPSITSWRLEWWSGLCWRTALWRGLFSLPTEFVPISYKSCKLGKLEKWLKHQDALNSIRRQDETKIFLGTEALKKGEQGNSDINNTSRCYA